MCGVGRKSFLESTLFVAHLNSLHGKSSVINGVVCNCSLLWPFPKNIQLSYYSGLVPLSYPILTMASEPKPATTEEVKMDLFEDDDEFEEFEINEEWDEKDEGIDVTQQWEDDWDDDDVSDDFSVQLKRELESNTNAEKN